MKFISIAAAALVALLSTQSSALAGTATFTDTGAFELATEGLAAQEENFDNFANGQPVTSLFGGLASFDASKPTIFFGNWNAFGTAGEFNGGSLIAEPRCQGHALAINFDPPVFGVGANAFDDYDGVHEITLVATTTTGEQVAVSESFPYVGDTGFLGATASEGITRVEVMDNGNSCLELDLLRVVPTSASDVCPCSEPVADPVCSAALLETQAELDLVSAELSSANASID